MPDASITISGNRRCVTQAPDPFYADAVSVSRFWRLVNVQAETECWPWRGDTDGAGYGVFTYRGRRAGAHEYALSFTTGERRLESLDTCHSCDNPPCCNPAHLRFDTHQSNVRDMHDRGRARNGSALSIADVLLIRERRAAGARQKDLADQFGLTDGAVSMIVRGIRWPHVGGPIQTERKYIRG